jgi:molybdopterin-guanine dinucleotide biosynthesis protein A
VARPRLTGVLLVGGASTRFGSPKALAQLGGETLAERAWRALGEACEERLAVGKRADGLKLPFDVIDDATETRAALAGIVAGLSAASNELAAVVPVDMPFITPQLLHELAAVCRDAAAPRGAPLPAVFRRSALPLLERRLADRELALHAALRELGAVEVQTEAALLVNVNTADELRSLG